MKKIYCYVDESGQDTGGEFFLVSVVISEKDREKLGGELQKIEKSSGKGSVKWTKAKDKARVAYIRRVLGISSLKGKLSYAVYKNTRDYLSKTILTTARAITYYVDSEYKAVILIDGLRKSETKRFGSELRHLHIRTEKVRGIKKEETDSIMRLADALCGFVRASILGRKEIKELLEKAKKNGRIREL